MTEGSLDEMPTDGVLPPAVFHSVIHAQQLTRPAAETGFATLRDLGLLAAGVEAATQDYVDAARRNGATWVQIGGALGISKQGAQQRWGRTRHLTDVTHQPAAGRRLTATPTTGKSRAP